MAKSMSWYDRTKGPSCTLGQRSQIARPPSSRAPIPRSRHAVERRRASSRTSERIVAWFSGISEPCWPYRHSKGGRWSHRPPFRQGGICSLRREFLVDKLDVDALLSADDTRDVIEEQTADDQPTEPGRYPPPVVSVAVHHRKRIDERD